MFHYELVVTTQDATLATSFIVDLRIWGIWKTHLPTTRDGCLIARNVALLLSERWENRGFDVCERSGHA